MIDSNKTTGHRFPLWLVVFGLCLGAVAFFAWKHDYVTASTGALVTLAGFCGYRAGALKMIGLALAAGVVYFYASSWGGHLADRVDFLNETMGKVAVGSAIMLSAVIVLRMVNATVIRKIPALRSANRWTGFALGSLQATGLVLLIMGGILAAEESARQRLGTEQNQVSQRVVRGVLAVADATRSSAIGTWVADNNPFFRLEPLRKLRRRLESEQWADESSDLFDESGNLIDTATLLERMKAAAAESGASDQR